MSQSRKGTGGVGEEIAQTRVPAGHYRCLQDFDGPGDPEPNQGALRRAEPPPQKRESKWQEEADVEDYVHRAQPATDEAVPGGRGRKRSLTGAGLEGEERNQPDGGGSRKGAGQARPGAWHRAQR